MTEQLPEFNRWWLTVIWVAIAVSAVTSAVSFRWGDLAWGWVFAACTAFFGLVAVGAHMQRRWNRSKRREQTGADI